MALIKKNDMVQVITGRDKGKKAKVLRVFPKDGKAIVENINLVKKAVRRTQQDQKAGIIEVEVPIQLSNLQLVCKQCSKPARMKIEVVKDGTRIRQCTKCSGAN